MIQVFLILFHVKSVRLDCTKTIVGKHCALNAVQENFKTRRKQSCAKTAIQASIKINLANKIVLNVA
jgi:hypothetical protein